MGFAWIRCWVFLMFLRNGGEAWKIGRMLGGGGGKMGNLEERWAGDENEIRGQLNGFR